MSGLPRDVFICVNARPSDHPLGCCRAKGAIEVRNTLRSELTKRGLSTTIHTTNTRCLDHCEHGVTIVVYPEQVWYGHVTADDIPEIVEKHLIGGEVVTRLLMPARPQVGEPIK